MSSVRRAARSFGIVLAFVAAPLAVLSVTTPVSVVGFVYVIGTLTVIAGLITAPKRVTRMHGVTRAGLALLVLVMLFRVATAGSGKTLTMTRGDGSAPVLDRLLPEHDVAVTSARAVRFTGMLPASDTKNLVSTLEGSFEKMAQEEGSYPSPIVRTALGLQDAHGYDVIEVVSPLPHPDSAVLFLHGYGGNFSLQCWAVARAAKLANASTFCPSTRLWGDWWRGDGPAIVEDMLQRLRARGFTRIVLAGLSNGGLGASAIAPKLHDKEIVGLLLISGAMSGAPAARVPTIAFEGSRDSMMPPAVIRDYANGTGATYVELDGTHFLLLEKLDAMTEKMSAWLVKRFSP